MRGADHVIDIPERRRIGCHDMNIDAQSVRVEPDRVLHALDTSASLELLLDKMKSTRTNVEFLMQIQKTTVTQD